MNFNDLILLLDSRLENLKQLSSMEIPYKVNGDGDEFFKTKDGYRIEYHNGIIEYINNNSKLHRIDGPAIEFANGSKYWYVNGEEMTEEEFNKWRAKNNPIKESRLENLKQLSSMEVPYRVDGGDEYYKTKDGYRIESINGSTFWCDNKDRYHRTDGPAVEWPDGSKHWYINGMNHRVDGPAIEYPNGHKLWYINDKKMSEEQFNRWRAKNNPSKWDI
jgi:hypothetical protein